MRATVHELAVGPGRVLRVFDAGPPAGTPLLLLPALGTTAQLWAPQLALTETGWRVLRIEAPGHGGAPEWPDLSLDTLAAAVAAIPDALHLGPLTLAGTSMGAVIALRAAARADRRVARLILCGARLQRAGAAARELGQRFTTSQNDLGQVATTMVGRWFPPACAAGHPPGWRDAALAELAAMVRATAPASYAACAQALASYDLLPELRALQQRAVLVTGALDEDIPEHFAALQGACPAARLVVLPGVGHFPAYEAPESFAALLASPTAPT